MKRQEMWKKTKAGEQVSGLAEMETGDFDVLFP
jgi:hypothetical protein